MIKLYQSHPVILDMTLLAIVTILTHLGLDTITFVHTPLDVVTVRGLNPPIVSLSSTSDKSERKLSESMKSSEPAGCKSEILIEAMEFSPLNYLLTEKLVTRLATNEISARFAMLPHFSTMEKVRFHLAKKVSITS